MYSVIAKDRLSFLDKLVEWLPVDVDGIGQMYLLHPVKFIEFPFTFKYNKNPVSKNVTYVSEYNFDNLDNVPSVFMVKQINESAGAKSNYAITGIFITNEIADVFHRTSGLVLIKVWDDGRN